MIKRSKLCGLLGALALAGAVQAQTRDAVTVQLDWVVRGNHAPFFVARDRAISPSRASTPVRSARAPAPPTRCGWWPTATPTSASRTCPR